MSADQQKKKKIAIVSVSSIILVAMVVAVAVGVTSTKGGSEDKTPATSSKAIDQVCEPTQYKETCKETLAASGGNVTDPKELVKLGMKIATEKLQEVMDKSTTLHEVAKDPIGNQALQNCKELIQYSIDDIKKTFGNMGSFDLGKIRNYFKELENWLSASVSYEQTCIDGFREVKGNAGDQMKNFLKQSQELTKNGLAMVSEISRLMGGGIPAATPKRRLLIDSDSKQLNPSWIDGRKLDLATTTVETLKPDLTVAQDGSGKYKTIGEALKEVPKESAKTFVVHIKEGEYKEDVVIEETMKNVMIIGDGANKTKITGDKCFTNGVHPFNTATVVVIGDYFIAKDIGFENSAGAKGKQATALRVQSDESIFYNCRFDGYQNTLFTQTYRQFYRDCTITGAVDMIFGDAIVVFQNCDMIIRKPENDDKATVTAQERSERRQPTAIVVQNSTVAADKDFTEKAVAFLGRPAHSYARTVFLQSKIDAVVNPEGWTTWTGETNTENCWFGEYSNRGEGAATNERVKWFNTVTQEQAEAFAPGSFLLGDSWIKPSGVPYDSELVRL